MPQNRLLIATRKGLFLLNSGDGRADGLLDEPLFLGHIVQHAVADPRRPSTILAAAKTGHLGPTVFRSLDDGKTWQEAQQPPAFEKAAANDGSVGRVLDHTFWLTPGHASELGVWWAGGLAAHPRLCGAAKTKVVPGRACVASMITRTMHCAPKIHRVAHPMVRCCIPFSSTRAAPITCIRVSRAVVSGRPGIVAKTGRH